MPAKSLDAKTDKALWDAYRDACTTENLIRRLEGVIYHHGWQEVVRVIAQNESDFGRLRVAEVGCGTATMSLAFGLMGAACTVLDISEKMIARAQRNFQVFRVSAEFGVVDCTAEVPENLRGQFDCVCSIGLAEHFTGAYRKSCFSFHRQLLKKGGLAMIAVPNALSPLYQLMRLIRVARGTWDIDLEVPFTPRGLRRIAREAGLSRPYVIAYGTLYSDFLYFGRSITEKLASLLRGQRFSRDKLEAESINKDISNVKDYLRQRLTGKQVVIKKTLRIDRRSFLADIFGAGIVLLARNSAEES